MARLRYTVPIAVVALLGLAACGSGSSGGGSAGGTIAGLSANDHGTKDVTGMTSVTVTANDFYFSPSVLKGSPGQKITVHFVNSTSTVHNITVSSQSISQDLNTGKTVDVSLTLPSSGVLAFWCGYHKSRGMVGGLLVSGPVAGTSPAPTPSTSGSSGGGYGGYGNG